VGASSLFARPLLADALAASEFLNVGSDFRYVTAGAFLQSARFGRRMEEAFCDPAELKPEPTTDAEAWDDALRARVGLFSPGGPFAQQFARNSTVLVVNDTVFAHAGLKPVHVRFGLERLNRDVSRWMLGDNSAELEPALELAQGLRGALGDSVVWGREVGREVWKTEAERYTSCRVARQTLAMIPGARRLVVGHTPQLRGVNCACDGFVWRIDVGLSRGVLGAAPQALEIVGDEVRVLGGQPQTAKELEEEDDETGTIWQAWPPRLLTLSRAGRTASS